MQTQRVAQVFYNLCLPFVSFIFLFNNFATKLKINTMKPNQTIINLAKSYGFDGAEYMTEWNGYKVYSPIFDDPERIAFIGEPVLILYNGKSTRIAASFEWKQILDTLADNK